MRDICACDIVHFTDEKNKKKKNRSVESERNKISYENKKKLANQM